MLAGIREILVITTPKDQTNYKKLLGDGNQFGINLSYAIQTKPEGLAQAFIIGEQFLGDAPSTLILGDNVFYGHELEKTLSDANAKKFGATIFGYHISDPEKRCHLKRNLKYPNPNMWSLDFIFTTNKCAPLPKN